MQWQLCRDAKIKSMQEAELLKICFYYLAQTELRSCYIDLTPFESCL